MKNWISVKPNGQGEITGQLLKFQPQTGVFRCVQANPTLRAGARVEDVQFELGEGSRYAGPIRIEEVVDTGLGCICSFSVQGELSAERAGGSSDSASRCRDLDGWLDAWRLSNRVLPGYRLLIADTASLFGSLSDWLLTEEQPLRGEPDREEAALRHRAEELGPNVSAAIDSVWEEFHTLADHISEDESALYRDYLRDHLQHYLMVSPFAWRSFNKPLGYAGDYECVNMIERSPYEGRSLFAMLVNHWLLQQLPSKAHRSRIDYLECRLMEEGVRMAAAGRPLRVFNLGCGPAIEIQRFLRDQEISSRAEFTLLDFSRETLDYTGGVLGDLKRRRGRQTRLRFVETNVRKLLRSAAGSRSSVSGRYDFIYCAGLFDYLPDAVCAQLLKLLHGWLDPGGLLLATNIKTTRAIELSLEYMLDWKLICRDKARFESLTPAVAEGDLVRTLGVNQGYNLFLEVRKAPE